MIAVAADKGVQLLAQEHWIKNYKDKHVWGMLPNADEFIVLKKVSQKRGHVHPWEPALPRAPVS